MKLQKIYTPKGSKIRQWKTQTDFTLLTSKILLGIGGIIPAHDTEFKKGIAKYNDHLDSAEKLPSHPYENMQPFIEFYNKKIKNTKADKYGFPPMKLVDMYFWQLGHEAPVEESNTLHP